MKAKESLTDLRKEMGIKPISRKYLKKEVRNLSAVEIIRLVRKEVGAIPSQKRNNPAA